MFGHKNKNLPEQGRARQSRTGERSTPAFSYYAGSRPAEAPRRSAERQKEDTRTANRVPRRRFKVAQLPFWLLMAVGVLCAVKLLALSTNPKIIVVGQSKAANNYVQPTQVYADAAHKLLSDSPLNRMKLTANVSGTTEQLQRTFPELETASLALPLIGNRPLLYVELAPPSVIVQSSQGNFALNKTGVVLAKLQKLPANIPMLTDQSGAVPAVSSRYLPGSTVSFLGTVAFQLQHAGYTVSTFVLPARNPYELTARVEGKPYTLRFNLQGDATTQSGAAIATLQQLGDKAPTNYLDVRTPDRVYYK